MSAPSSAQVGGVAIAAQRAATVLEERLGRIEQHLHRLVELAEAPRKNYLGVGTIPGGFTVGTAAVVIIEANANRRGLNVQNLAAAGGASITVGLGNRAPTPGTGIVLAPGQSFDGRVSGMLWIGSVALISTQAGVPYSFLEA